MLASYLLFCAFVLCCTILGARLGSRAIVCLGLQVTSQPVSSRPSSRDLSPAMRNPSTRATDARPAPPVTTAAAATSSGPDGHGSAPGAALASPRHTRETAESTISLANAMSGVSLGHMTADSIGGGALPSAQSDASLAALQLHHPVSAANGATTAGAAATLMPAAPPPELPPASKRVRGTVTRLLKKSKRLPAGVYLGVLRSASNENWARPKAAEGASPRARDAPSLPQLVKNKGLGALQVFTGDVLFWSTDVAKGEQRDALQRHDEVEYVVVPWPLEQGDTHRVDMAFDVSLVRASRPAQPAKWQPPATPHPASGGGGGLTAAAAAGDTARKAPKFYGAAAVQVPGPEKGSTGFGAGRGRAITPPKARIESFRFEDVVSAHAFVPKRSGSLDALAGGAGGNGSASREPLAAMLTTNPFDDQFEDADM
jgi:hypothetical protein